MLQVHGRPQEQQEDPLGGAIGGDVPGLVTDVLAETGAGQPEGRPAGFVRGLLGLVRREALRGEFCRDRLGQHRLGLEAELPQLRVGGGGEELEPMTDEAGRVAARLTDHAGALGADVPARIMLAQAFPEQGVQFGQRALEPVGQGMPGVLDRRLRPAPGMRGVEQVEPGFDHAQVKESYALLGVQDQFVPMGLALAREQPGQFSLRLDP